MTLAIDIISDVVCPWCYIGKRRLESALALYRERQPGAPEPTITWHPFELNPDMPDEGIAREDYVARKFGARGKDVYKRVASVGEQVGIPFAFDKVGRQPNTRRVHALIAAARDSGRQGAVKEGFLRAYFLEGTDLTRRENLEAVALAAGLDRETVRATLDSDEVLGQVAAEEEHARDLGVEGVPFFIFNQKVAVSGAQEPEALLGAMLEAEKVTEAEAD